MTSAVETGRPTLEPGRWDPVVREGLVAMIAAHGAGSPGYSTDDPPVATLDWDDTCMAGDICEAILLDEDPHAMEVYSRMIREQGILAAYTYCAEALGGRSEADLKAATARMLESQTRTGAIRERPEMLELIAALWRYGWDVWIVSGAAEPVVQVAAARYGFGPDRVVGMKLATRSDGFVEKRVVGPVTTRGGKVEAIDRTIGRRPVFAAGDHDSDIEMLGAARYALVIGGNGTEIGRVARDRGWWIQKGL